MMCRWYSIVAYLNSHARTQRTQLRMSIEKPYAKWSQTTQFKQLRFRALVQTAVSGKGGRINETKYPYSIISFPYL